ncbi:unnamed protein product [Leptidea sinapis]|uniref:Fatty acid desaturase domain-containing protein n=1 Tax=Leptidea sinapis TaxID=189913 RepID=A0A5E4QXA3_9NEOP|nr:unnamed protein product [Leptidea sinapis]
MVAKDQWTEIAQERILKKKTHTSFPQLKYPSLRDKGFRDPVQWLTGKALDDGAEGLWRIHDKIYDFTSFMNNHPDITEAFESHHIIPATEKLLTKYYLREAMKPRNSPFTFKDDGFYRTLKRAAHEELKELPKYASREANVITDGLFVTLLCSSSLASWVTNYSLAVFWYVVASASLALLTVACHNFIHRRTNWRMYLFNMSLWSYRDFRISHVLSHHLYTNTLMDAELSTLEPFLIYNPRINNFRFLSVVLWQGSFNSHLRWHDAIGLTLPLIMWLTSAASVTHVIYTWLCINCTGSLLFFLIAVNAAHHHPDAMKDGDEPRNETVDWGEHQVEALLDRKDVNSNSFAVMTLFGDHALHHMFPTLDHTVLKYLHPIFLKVCKQYQTNYRSSTQFELAIGQIKETMRTTFKTYEERKNHAYYKD